MDKQPMIREYYLLITLCQRSGTRLSNILLKTSSSSADITTNPSIAFVRFSNDFLTVTTNLLNLRISCCKTVFIDSSYLTGYFLTASSKSKGLGTFPKIVLHFSFIISSVEAPPAPPTKGIIKLYFIYLILAVAIKLFLKVD